MEQLSTLVACGGLGWKGPRVQVPGTSSSQHFFLLGQEAKTQQPRVALELESQSSPRLCIEPPCGAQFRGGGNPEEGTSGPGHGAQPGPHGTGMQ